MATDPELNAGSMKSRPGDSVLGAAMMLAMAQKRSSPYEDIGGIGGSGIMPWKPPRQAARKRHSTLSKDARNKRCEKNKRARSSRKKNW